MCPRTYLSRVGTKGPLSVKHFTNISCLAANMSKALIFGDARRALGSAVTHDVRGSGPHESPVTMYTLTTTILQPTPPTPTTKYLSPATPRGR